VRRPRDSDIGRRCQPGPRAGSPSRGARVFASGRLHGANDALVKSTVGTAYRSWSTSSSWRAVEGVH
jgi:hypothetical protein